MTHSQKWMIIRLLSSLSTLFYVGAILTGLFFGAAIGASAFRHGFSDIFTLSGDDVVFMAVCIGVPFALWFTFRWLAAFIKVGLDG